MKAVALTNVGKAEILDIAEPARGEGDVLLRVELVGMCGSDLNSFRGRNAMVSYPRVIGHEVAATVIEGSVALAPGTRVTISPYTNCGRCASCRRGRVNACKYNQTLGVQRDGAMTELLSVPEQKIYPSALSLKELCLTEPLTVGMHAVSRGRVKPGDVVAIFGCGGVGLGAVCGAAFRGARTIAIDLDDDKLEIARLAGAAELIHSGRDSVHEQLQQITDGLGPDVVIEAIGLPETFRAAVDEVAFAGRVIYIGYSKEPVFYETHHFVQKELDIMGSRNALPEDFHEVMRILEQGRFPVEQAVSTVVQMQDAATALQEWSANPRSFTKIMVEIG